MLTPGSVFTVRASVRPLAVSSHDVILKNETPLSGTACGRGTVSPEPPKYRPPQRRFTAPVPTGTVPQSPVPTVVSNRSCFGPPFAKPQHAGSVVVVVVVVVVVGQPLVPGYCWQTSSSTIASPVSTTQSRRSFTFAIGVHDAPSLVFSGHSSHHGGSAGHLPVIRSFAFCAAAPSSVAVRGSGHGGEILPERTESSHLSMAFSLASSHFRPFLAIVVRQPTVTLSVADGQAPGAVPQSRSEPPGIECGVGQA